jgi:hypothetical protein
MKIVLVIAVLLATYFIAMNYTTKKQVLPEAFFYDGQPIAPEMIMFAAFGQPSRFQGKGPGQHHDHKGVFSIISKKVAIEGCKVLQLTEYSCLDNEKQNMSTHLQYISYQYLKKYKDDYKILLDYSDTQGAEQLAQKGAVKLTKKGICQGEMPYL